MGSTVLLCTTAFHAEYGKALAEIDPELDVVLLPAEGHLAQADLERITIGYFSVDTWPDQVRAYIGSCLRAPNLTWLHTFSAGTDDDVFNTLRGRGITVTSGAGAAAATIAQTAVMYLLVLSRELPAMLADQAVQRWNPRRIVDLHGTRLGIVGLGSIGSELARLATALGMQVIGTRRTVRGDEPCEAWPDSRLHELLAWADVIAVTAPLTDATRGLLDADALATMRSGSWLINVGRGEIVDERALVGALRSGHIGAAALDVFAVEPLPVDSPLWTMPNVIVTPHCSGESPLSDRRSNELFVENFRRYATKRSLLNVTE